MNALLVVTWLALPTPSGAVGGDARRTVINFEDDSLVSLPDDHFAFVCVTGPRRSLVDVLEDLRRPRIRGSVVESAVDARPIVR